MSEILSLMNYGVLERTENNFRSFILDFRESNGRHWTFIIYQYPYFYKLNHQFKSCCGVNQFPFPLSYIVVYSFSPPFPVPFSSPPSLRCLVMIVVFYLFFSTCSNHFIRFTSILLWVSFIFPLNLFFLITSSGASPKLHFNRF